jgi:predicted  nucleic acid-binding Zn-ribbon protein
MDLRLIPDLPNVVRVWRETEAKKKALQEERETVRATIKMQEEGIEKYRARVREIDQEIDDIWEQEDRAWDADMGRCE